PTDGARLNQRSTESHLPSAVFDRCGIRQHAVEARETRHRNVEQQICSRSVRAPDGTGQPIIEQRKVKSGVGLYRTFPGKVRVRNLTWGECRDTIVSRCRKQTLRLEITDGLISRSSITGSNFQVGYKAEVANQRLFRQCPCTRDRPEVTELHVCTETGRTIPPEARAEEILLIEVVTRNGQVREQARIGLRTLSDFWIGTAYAIDKHVIC